MGWISQLGIEELVGGSVTVSSTFTVVIMIVIWSLVILVIFFLTLLSFSYCRLIIYFSTSGVWVYLIVRVGYLVSVWLFTHIVVSVIGITLGLV